MSGYQAVLVEPPTTSEAWSTPSETIWLPDRYEEIEIEVEYEAYAVGTYVLYYQQLVVLPLIGNYWVTIMSNPIPDSYGAGLFRLHLPWAPDNVQDNSDALRTSMWGDEPEPTPGDPFIRYPQSAIRIVAKSGSGITPGGAYAWHYMRGLKEKKRG